jgi:hypothetical protein
VGGGVEGMEGGLRLSRGKVVVMESVGGWVLVSAFVALFNVLPWDATNQQQASGEPTLVLGTGPR